MKNGPNIVTKSSENRPKIIQNGCPERPRHPSRPWCGQGRVKGAREKKMGALWAPLGGSWGPLGSVLIFFWRVLEATWALQVPSRPPRGRSRSALRGTRGFQKRCGDAFDDNPSKNRNYTFRHRKTYDFDVPGGSQRGRTGHLWHALRQEVAIRMQIKIRMPIAMLKLSS